jgi:hypothetical protein
MLRSIDKAFDLAQTPSPGIVCTKRILVAESDENFSSNLSRLEFQNMSGSSNGSDSKIRKTEEKAQSDNVILDESTKDIGKESTPPSVEISPSVTRSLEQEKIQRELEESERLAWELMRQEHEEAYKIQMEYLNSNAASISNEDLALLQTLVNETGRQPLVGAEAHEDEEQEEEADSEELDYDRLLELGAALGDVKTDRWRLRANRVMAGFSRFVYSTLVHKMKKVMFWG